VHGFDGVTIDDIAVEAGVSRRTFFRYFASKEDVLLADHQLRLEELQEAFGGRPREEPVLTALRNALLSMAFDYEQERQRLLIRARVMAESPSLQARSLLRQRSWEDAVRAMVASRLEVDPARDLRPAVVAATTLAALRVAFTAWLAEEGRPQLLDLVAEALDLLNGGLQQVARPTP